jgi:multicomponent K+:H+ antiporter subunit D
MSGLPPLSGFIGKILILDATLSSPWLAWVWSVLLVSSIAVIFGMARAGSVLFWKSGSTGAEAIDVSPEIGAGIRLGVVAMLLAATVLLSALAGPATRLTAGTAGDLLARDRYVDAVLGQRPAAAAQAEP